MHKTDFEEITGVEVPVIIDGETVKVRQLTLLELNEVEREILSNRKDNPIEEAAKACLELESIKDEKLRAELIDKTLKMGYEFKRQREYVTLEDYRIYLSTVEGLCFGQWLAMKKQNPNVTREEANAFFEKMHASFLEEQISNLCDNHPTLSPDEAREVLMGKDASALLEALSGHLHGMTTSDPTQALAETEAEPQAG